MGGGFAVTLKRSKCGSSQTVIGSTKGPVEKTQWRTAPRPRPTISARIGYAIPARKIGSFGGGISANAITSCQTFSCGALTSIADFTTNTPACGFTKCSKLKEDGNSKTATESMAGTFLRPQ